MQEERRLAYVGITRAKEELHLIKAKTRILFGNTNRNSPSQFLIEIPRDLLSETTTIQKAEQTEHRGGIKPRDTVMSGAKSFGTAAPVQLEECAVYNVGDTVRHKTFGQGMIVSTTPMGNDAMLEIAFDKVGTKKLMAKYARLEKL